MLLLPEFFVDFCLVVRGHEHPVGVGEVHHVGDEVGALVEAPQRLGPPLVAVLPVSIPPLHGGEVDAPQECLQIVGSQAQVAGEFAGIDATQLTRPV